MTSASQPELLTINLDFTAQAAAIRAAADPAAHLRSLVSTVVDAVIKEVHRRSSVAGAIAALKSPELSAMLAQARSEGYVAGQRTLALNKESAAALGQAIAAGMTSGQQPVPVVVNVPQQPAPKVTIENNVVVPARKVIARTNPRDGTVEMTPVDESTR